MRAAVRALTFPAAGVAAQHRGIAAPVQQHHGLLAARHAFADGRQQWCRKHRARRLQAHIDQAHLGQAGIGAFCAYAAGHGDAAVAPRVGAVPAFQRRRGRTQNHLGAFQPRTVDRQIARRITRAVLALVAGVVLFVDHDQAQPWHGGQHRQPRAQHDARPALGRPTVRRQPGLQALRRGHAAVQRNHGGFAITRRKALLKARQQLRRQVDLRHHHQCLGQRVAFQQRLHRVQIDLGLAAAGGAKQQKGAILCIKNGQSPRLL